MMTNRTHSIFGATAQVMTPEDVREHDDEQPEPDEEDKQPQHRAEQVGEGVGVGDHRWFLPGSVDWRVSGHGCRTRFRAPESSLAVSPCRCLHGNGITIARGWSSPSGGDFTCDTGPQLHLRKPGYGSHPEVQRIPSARALAMAPLRLATSSFR